MQIGACHACGTPYTSQELAGLGILRARPAAAGGPRLEYRCAGCAVVLTLVPHGEGRYAPPGASPPGHVPEEARRPAWTRSAAAPGANVPAGATTGGAATGGATTGSATTGGATTGAAGAAARAGAGTGTSSAAASGALTLVAAYELLGVPVTSDRETLEKAFRARSLACHPDKVAHLDEDFRALAELKFKRLVEAFRLVSEVHPG
ncbi:MAG: J domain-containing protein [Planctomycetia bacterium]